MLINISHHLVGKSARLLFVLKIIHLNRLRKKITWFKFRVQKLFRCYIEIVL